MTEPLVSIGIPVFNGENYLAETLDGILAQDFADFEVVITDNASTDGTEEICRKYAETDARVRYHRQQANYGAAPNYNDAFHRSRAKYFKWSAHDDLLAPTFLSRCVQELEANQAVVVAFTGSTVIDAEGNQLGTSDPRTGLTDRDVATRVRTAIFPFIKGGASDAAIFGVMRSSAVDKTSLHGSYTGSDRTLLLELALQGPFATVPEPLFYNRDHPDRSIRIRRKVADRGHVREVWFDTQRAGKIVFPNWRRLREFLTAIMRSSVGPLDKVRACRVVGSWVARWSWKRLLNDLYLGSMMLFSRRRRPKDEASP
jgi:glycosyltransferase involved in cell wall biosynthesis